jgi:hypothetical protein
MKRRLGVLAVAISLAACGSQATDASKPGTAGATQTGTQTAGAEALQPTESTFDREAREEAVIATRNGTPMQELAAPESTVEEAKADEPARASAKRGRRHARRAENKLASGDGPAKAKKNKH